MTKVRIGIVSFTNALPLVEGLDRERNVEITSAVPAELNKMLKKGELDLALLSSIEVFRNQNLRMLPEIAVCSEGAIKSIKLYLRVPLEEVQTVALDKSSCTAATLTRVIFSEFLEKPEVEFQDIDPQLDPDNVQADAVLLIGDPALQAEAGDRQVLDLGAYWTERTGLPFVYAVWACHKKFKSADRFLPILLRARDRGLVQRPRLAQDAADRLSLPAAGIKQYLTRNLRYQLGERELKGLERFRDLAAEHGLCTRHDVPFVGARVQMT